MSKIVDYVILSANNPTELATAVKVSILSGFEPFGNVFIEDLTKPGMTVSPMRKYCQPIIKYQMPNHTTLPR